MTEIRIKKKTIEKQTEFEHKMVSTEKLHKINKDATFLHSHD